MFKNPGKAVQNIATFFFFACLFVALLLFMIGCVKILIAIDEGTTFREVMEYTAGDYVQGLSAGHNWIVYGYEGKTQCKTAIFIALASLPIIPMYAFGCLVEDVATIKKKLLQEKQDDND